MIFSPQIPLPTTNLPTLHHHIRLVLLCTAKGKSAFRVSTTLKALDGFKYSYGIFLSPCETTTNVFMILHDLNGFRALDNQRIFEWKGLFHCSMLLRLDGA